MGGERGYDGGKHVKGRKRHLVVDTLGLPLGLSVTPANIHDTRGGQNALRRTHRFLRGHPFKKLYADGGYRGEPFAQFVSRNFQRAKVIISGNPAQKFKAFLPVSQRWVIERTFAWVYDYRRLTIDYERARISPPSTGHRDVGSQSAAQVMGAHTGLHPDQTRRHVREPCFDMAA